MDYARRLKSALTLAKADRKALADALGISVQAVGAVLTGDSKTLTAENTAKAARFLQVDYYWLATGEGEPRPALMQERANLTDEAIEHATQFDKLTTGEKRLWRTLVIAARNAVTDAEVEERMPATKRAKVNEDQILKKARPPALTARKTHKKEA